MIYGNVSHIELMRRFGEVSPRPIILRAKHMPGNRKAPKTRDPEATASKGPPQKNTSRGRWRIDFVGDKPNLVGMEVVTGE